MIPASLTISCAFVAEREQEVERQVGRLETYVAEQGYTRLGDAVLIERSYLSLFGGGGSTMSWCRRCRSAAYEQD
ncbi:hypothetical protein PA598K_06357 [Paenibacillus sp. 598K]|uniref:hypothetical protein n=1 Tax=Paenibacillus sp. 598K TaxID=1117987 RepID=UPI000FF9151D|nr:hypothetical protein [Paenibacillus sp. 598K]GBF77787.1 hypothetical protein PA598K_06357 [Paenibacillus sp. 598K]